MKTFLVAWAGDVPGAKFLEALTPADACHRLDFVPAFLVRAGAGAWNGRDALTNEELAIVLVQLDADLDLDLTETIAVLAAGQRRTR